MARKIIQAFKLEWKKIKLFTEDMFIYVESPKEYAKKTMIMKKGV
jgi:hypothetical protein